MPDASTQTKVLRGFSILGVIASILTILFYLRAPSTEGTSVLLGYSWSRLVIILLIALSAVAFLWLAVSVWRRRTSGRILQYCQALLGRGEIRIRILMGALLVFCICAVIVLLSVNVKEGSYYYYLARITPLVVWLAYLSMSSIVALIVFVERFRPFGLVAFLLPLVILLLGMAMHMRLWHTTNDPRGNDIFYLYQEGHRLLEGENPYTRILSGDMLVNQKYPTHLPLFYYLSWFTQAIGLNKFFNWLDFWKVIFLWFNLGVALLLFYIPMRRNMLVLAVFGSLFWLFNRWSLLLTTIMDIDYIPIFLLILSLLLFPRHKIWSILLFSLSLGVKHVALFHIPLYLIWTWQELKDRPVWQTVKAGIILIAPLLVISLPFILLNWEGFYKSILFTATRLPSDSFRAPSLDDLLGWIGLPAKIPLFIMIALVYLLAWQRKTRFFTATLLVMTSYLFFNSNFFKENFVWIIPFIPLAAYELADNLNVKV